MRQERESERIDAAARLIAAPAGMVFAALLDADSVAAWLPPEGMTGRIEVFEPREGGAIRMTLRYLDAGHAAPGKTTEDSDTVEGRFEAIEPSARIVQSFTFLSQNPAFAGRMRMTWNFRPVGGGTEVTVRCEDVPAGQEDHLTGLTASR